jgi:Zn-dependent protease
MKQYFKVKHARIFGAPLYLHWSVFIAVGVCLLNGFKDPISAIASVCSYYTILLVHESGHALVVRHLGYRVYEIQLLMIHGLCRHSGDLYSEWHDVAIAWGGVLAQFALALLMVLLSFIPGIDRIPGMTSIVGVLGPVNIAIAIFNLVPVPPLDGAKAWRIIPLLFERWRPRRSRKKPKRSHFGPVK